MTKGALKANTCRADSFALSQELAWKKKKVHSIIKGLKLKFWVSLYTLTYAYWGLTIW